MHDKFSYLKLPLGLHPQEELTGLLVVLHPTLDLLSNHVGILEPTLYRIVFKNRIRPA